MAEDIRAINSGNPINNYSVLVHYPCATGISAGTIYTGRAYNEPDIDEIKDKYDTRFDDVSYYVT